MAGIIKLKAEMNQVETKRKNQPNQMLFFEKINKIDKPLAKLTRGHRDSIQSNKIRNEKGSIKTETMEIQNCWGPKALGISISILSLGQYLFYNDHF